MNIDQDRSTTSSPIPPRASMSRSRDGLTPTTAKKSPKLSKPLWRFGNRNGGFFLIGFDDQSLMPDTGTRPPDVRTVFHLDKVQALVSKYASEIFEIGVGFGNRDGLEYPVIVIPEGVVAPVAAKRGLMDDAGHCLIREGEFYFRNLDQTARPARHGRSRVTGRTSLKSASRTKKPISDDFLGGIWLVAMRGLSRRLQGFMDRLSRPLRPSAMIRKPFSTTAKNGFRQRLWLASSTRRKLLRRRVARGALPLSLTRRTLRRLLAPTF